MIAHINHVCVNLLKSLVSHQRAAFNIVGQIMPNAGNYAWLSITGILGVGESTFFENLGVFFEKKGHNTSVIVLARQFGSLAGSVCGTVGAQF